MWKKSTDSGVNAPEAKRSAWKFADALRPRSPSEPSTFLPEESSRSSNNRSPRWRTTTPPKKSAIPMRLRFDGAAWTDEMKQQRAERQYFLYTAADTFEVVDYPEMVDFSARLRPRKESTLAAAWPDAAIRRRASAPRLVALCAKHAVGIAMATRPIVGAPLRREIIQNRQRVGCFTSNFEPLTRAAARRKR